MRVSIFVLLFSIGSPFTQLGKYNVSSYRKNLVLAHLELHDYLVHSILTEEEKKNRSSFPVLVVKTKLSKHTGYSLANAPFHVSYSSIPQSQKSPKTLKYWYERVNAIVVLQDPLKKEKEDMKNMIEQYKNLGIELMEIAYYPVRRGEIEFDVSVLRFQKD